MIDNTDDFAFAVKDREGYYFIGYNKWDKQLRKRSYITATNMQKRLEMM